MVVTSASCTPASARQCAEANKQASKQEGKGGTHRRPMRAWPMCGLCATRARPVRRADEFASGPPQMRRRAAAIIAPSRGRDLYAVIHVHRRCRQYW